MNKFLWKIHKIIFKTKGKVEWLDEGDSCYIVEIHNLSLSCRIHKFKVSCAKWTKYGNYTLQFQTNEPSSLVMDIYNDYHGLAINPCLVPKYCKKFYDGKLIINANYDNRFSSIIFTTSKSALIDYIKNLYKHNSQCYTFCNITPQEYYRQYYRKAIQSILDYKY